MALATALFKNAPVLIAIAVSGGQPTGRCGCSSRWPCGNLLWPKNTVLQRWKTAAQLVYTGPIDHGGHNFFTVASFRDHLAQRIDEKAVTAVLLAGLGAGRVARKQVCQVFVCPGAVEKQPRLAANARPGGYDQQYAAP